MVDSNLHRLYAARRASAEDYAIWADAWMNAASVQLAKSQGSIAHDVAVESEMAHESLSALTSVIQEGIDRAMAELPIEIAVRRVRERLSYGSDTDSRDAGRLLDRIFPPIGRVIRNVEDARLNLQEVAADAASGKPIDPETLAAAEAAVNRVALSAGEPDGMETTADERDECLQAFADIGPADSHKDHLLVRLLRDHDRLLAALPVVGSVASDGKPETLQYDNAWFDRRETVEALSGLLGEARTEIAREAKAREEGEEAVLRFIEGGSFLHDDAPPKRFADEVIAAYRGRSKS